MTARILRYSTLAALLISVFVMVGVPVRAQDHPDCAGVDEYMRSVQTLQMAYGQAMGDIDEGDVEDWTPEQFDIAITAATTLTTGLRSITRPPAAAELHATLIESFKVWTDMIESVSDTGVMGALIFLDKFDELSTKIDEQGLAFELACNVAFIDHDDDGTPELGSGNQATPVTSAGIDPIAPAGSFQNPAPVGESQNVGGGWEITVVSVTPDATEAVLAENTFNQPPDEGRQFFVAEVMVTNVGTTAQSFDGNFRLRANGQSSEYTYRPFSDRCGVVANEWEAVDIAPGESVTANACWSVLTGDVPYLKMFDVDAVTETRVFFALFPGSGQAAPIATPTS